MYSCDLVVVSVSVVVNDVLDTVLDFVLYIASVVQHEVSFTNVCVQPSRPPPFQGMASFMDDYFKPDVIAILQFKNNQSHQ